MTSLSRENITGDLPGDSRGEEADLHAEMGELRGDLGDLHGDVGDLRGDLHGDVGDLHGGVGDLHGKLHGDLGDLHGGVGDLHGDLHGNLRSDLPVEKADSLSEAVARLLERLDGERTRRELRDAISLGHREHFRKHYLQPALESRFIEMVLPDRSNIRNQRYRLTDSGRNLRRFGDGR